MEKIEHTSHSLPPTSLHDIFLGNVIYIITVTLNMDGNIL
jgi:hypothetical protein